MTLTRHGQGRPAVVKTLADVTLEPVESVPPVMYGNAVARYRIQQFLESGAPAAAVRSELPWRSVYDAMKHAIKTWPTYIPVEVQYRRSLDGGRTVYLQRTGA